MLFHEMQYVYEVYRQGSFSKAAKVLYISQPSLSQMIKKAEMRIGGDLFDRSTSPVTLTALGHVYIQTAEELMHIENRFHQYLLDSKQYLTGSLALGGTLLFSSYVLPPLISSFSSRYPGVEISLHEHHSSTLSQKLKEGTIDLVMGNTALDPNVYISVFYQQEQIMAAVPQALVSDPTLSHYGMTAFYIQHNDILTKPALPLELLSDLPFLMLKEGNDTRIRAEKLCALCGFQPNIELELDQQVSAYQLAAYGMGATFVSDTLVRKASADSRLLFFRLDGEEASRPISLSYWKKRDVTAPMKAFIQLTKEYQETLANGTGLILGHVSGSSKEKKNNENTGK